MNNIIKMFLFMFILLLFSACLTEKDDDKKEEILKKDYFTFNTFLEDINNLEESKREEFFNLNFESLKKNIEFPVVDGENVTFVYLGTDLDKVYLTGGFINYREEKLINLEGTDLYYLEKTLSQDARIEYNFVTEKSGKKNKVVDSLNNNNDFIKISSENSSQLVMPDYEIKDEINYDDNIEHGTLVKDLKHMGKAIVDGEIVDVERTFHVYLPFNYQADKEYEIIYFNNGKEFLLDGNVNNVLDYMIANEEIEPVIGVFLEAYNWDEEYLNAKRNIILDYITEDFIPYIESEYPIKTETIKRTFVGFGNAGIFAYYAGCKRADVFTNIIIESPRFINVSEDGGYPFRLYHMIGKYSPWLEVNREYKEIFQQAESMVNYEYIEISEGDNLYSNVGGLREALLWISNGLEPLNEKFSDFENNGDFSFNAFFDYINNLDAESAYMFYILYFDRLKGNWEFPIVDGENVKFVYRGDVLNVSLMGGFNHYNKEEMENIEGTPLYYIDKSFSTDARIEYEYVISKYGEETKVYDPLNPNRGLSGMDEDRPSELTMPDFEEQPEIEYYEDIEHGTVIKNLTHNGEAVETWQIVEVDRMYHIYLPPNYNEAQEYNVVYFNDGKDFIIHTQCNNVFDYMIANNEIEPTIGVFIEYHSRPQDYIYSKDVYLDYLVEDFLPYIENEYAIRQESSSRCMVGVSNSGAFSLYAGYKYPEVFGNIISESGALNALPEDSFNSETLKTMELPFRLYQVVGTYEPWLYINRTYNQSLVENTTLLDYNYLEVPEGHTLYTWRNVLREGLMWTFGTLDN